MLAHVVQRIHTLGPRSLPRDVTSLEWVYRIVDQCGLCIITYYMISCSSYFTCLITDFPFLCYLLVSMYIAMFSLDVLIRDHFLMTSLTLRGWISSCSSICSWLSPFYPYFLIIRRPVNLDFTLSEFSPWVSNAVRISFFLRFLPVASFPPMFFGAFFMLLFFGAKILAEFIFLFYFCYFYIIT